MGGGVVLPSDSKLSVPCKNLLLQRPLALHEGAWERSANPVTVRVLPARPSEPCRPISYWCCARQHKNENSTRTVMDFVFYNYVFNITDPFVQFLTDMSSTPKCSVNTFDAVRHCDIVWNYFLPLHTPISNN